MAPGARNVRMKKLSRTQGQIVQKEDQLDEVESLTTQPALDTGVEKSEEKEFHLQAVIANSTSEIPAPQAGETPNFDYDALYSLKFDKPATYIRFSQTVEDCTGCQYDMTTEDDLFLQAYNKDQPAAAKLTEDEFETIFQFFEQITDELYQHATISKVVCEWERIEQLFQEAPYRKAELHNSKLLTAAREIHKFWKDRRERNEYEPLQPRLKQEVSPEAPADGDPYVCFRRREVRQTRKTRARDNQISEKLRKLRQELEKSRDLVIAIQKRELAKQENLQVDKNVFETRSEFRKIKQKTGIKNNDDEILLINQKPQKRKIPEFSGFSRQPPGQQLRLPGARSDGRALDAELVQLSDLQAQKENIVRTEIQEKSRQHEVWNSAYEDLTREPLSPVTSGFQTGFRPATAQYQLLTPPSSINSEALDHPSPIQDKFDPSARYSTEPEEEGSLGQGQPAYRKRLGRNNRLWIDRRGLSSAARSGDAFVSDRWKYDQDDDDEQPVYEMDPYDTQALRFRATIPFPQHLIPQRAVQQARANGPSGPSNRSIAAAPPPGPT